jgi:hypothetical protein
MSTSTGREELWRAFNEAHDKISGTEPGKARRAGFDAVLAILDAAQGQSDCGNLLDEIRTIKATSVNIHESTETRLGAIKDRCDDILNAVPQSVLAQRQPEPVTGAGSGIQELLLRAETYLDRCAPDGRGSGLLVMELADALKGVLHPAYTAKERAINLLEERPAAALRAMVVDECAKIARKHSELHYDKQRDLHRKPGEGAEKAASNCADDIEEEIRGLLLPSTQPASTREGICPSCQGHGIVRVPVLGGPYTSIAEREGHDDDGDD